MGDVIAGYDKIGSECLGRAQQGTINLKNAMLDRWPSRSLGIYNCRNVRGGKSKSSHAEGRGYDHQWFDKASGFKIAETLIANCGELGIQRVIWWRRIWTWGEGWDDYFGESPHTDHLHVEQNWSGAWWLQYADAVAAVAAHAPHPKPRPEEDDPMLAKIMHWNGAIFAVGYDPNPFDGTIEDAQGNTVPVTGAVGPWRKTFPDVPRLAQVVGGGACITDHGNAFDVTNNQFLQVYVDRGPA